MIFHAEQLKTLYDSMSFLEKITLFKNGCRSNQICELPKLVDYIKKIAEV
jgi:hypothetical protein